MTDEIKELKMEIKALESENNELHRELEIVEHNCNYYEIRVLGLEKQLEQSPIPNNTLEDSLKIELLNEYWDSINYLSLRDYLQNLK